MNINIRKFTGAMLALLSLATVGCTWSVTLSGASIPVQAETYSVDYFPNNAMMVSATLSPTFTDALKDKFARQTRLSEVRENGDFHFEGEIVNYTDNPTAVSATQETSQMNRLTVTVRVRFTNSIEPENSFERSFSAYEDYDSNTPLTSAEASLIPEIVDKIVDDIFNAAASNW